MNSILFEEAEVTDSQLILNDHRFKHIKSVLRSEVGNKVKTGQINGHMGTSTLLSIDDSSATLQIDDLHQPPPPASNISLLLALPRPKVVRRVLRSATELGIKHITLVNAWRVEKSYWQSPVLSAENIRKTLIEGLSQAVDTRLPTVELETLFKPFVEDRLPTLAQGKRLILPHPYTDQTITPTHRPTILAIGPEGGFIPYEVEQLQKQGFEVVKLGSNILRVETAMSYAVGRLG